MNMLDKNAAGDPDNCGLERVAYLRGDQTNEGANGPFSCASSTSISKFRQRNTSKLGDIVNSNPWYVGAPSAGFSDLDYPGYSAFRRAKLTRKSVVYMGGNDGMLHGFDASLDTTTVAAGLPTATSGNEVLAYIPSAVFSNLSKLTAQTYNQNHLYFVDGSPMIGDVDLTRSNWHTVLVGALAAGGKGFYALDITEPSLFSESNSDDILLWEFNDTDDVDMGFAFNLPPASSATGQAKQIIKLANGKWAVIVGNGYNSSSGKAVLYILFINDGVDGTWSASDYVKIVADAPVGLDNGLSTPVPFDTNDDGYADTVYAGDLKGNMWKFLVGPNNSDTAVTGSTLTWKVAFSGNSLFTATDSSILAQPIIWPPEVTLHPSGGQMILFGTGKYIEPADKNNTDTQTFYGIWDRHTTTGTPLGSRVTDLLPQTLTESALAGGDFRIPTNKAINWRPLAPLTFPLGEANCKLSTPTCTPTHMGWYLDLPTTGERSTGIPRVINQVIFFNTLIPSSTICSPGTGWLMSLDYLNGGLPSRPIFGTSGTGTFNSSDIVVGGFQVGAALGGTTFIQNLSSLDSNNIGVGVSSLTSGDLKPIPINFGSGTKGRQSWRELLQ
jgi:type IV pilus assembly protein PilY1